MIQTDDSRKQSNNVDGCYTKLYELIVDAASDVLPGETSAEQRRRVVVL